MARRAVKGIKSPLLVLPSDKATIQQISLVFDAAFDESTTTPEEYEDRITDLVKRYPDYARAYVQELSGRSRVILFAFLKASLDGEIDEEE